MCGGVWCLVVCNGVWWCVVVCGGLLTAAINCRLCTGVQTCPHSWHSCKGLLKVPSSCWVEVTCCRVCPASSSQPSGHYHQVKYRLAHHSHQGIITK